VDESELVEEEICSICHDNLVIARKLKCNHKFHMFYTNLILTKKLYYNLFKYRKCLFFWLKAQQNTSCPICRSEIPNITFLKHQKRSWLYRIISIIANLTDLNIRFVTGRINQDANQENVNANNNNAF